MRSITFLSTICLLIVFATPVSGFRVQEEVEVRLVIQPYFDMEIDFIRDHMEVFALEEEVDGLVFSQEMIEDELAGIPLLDIPEEHFPLTVDHGDIIQVTTLSNMGHRLLLSADREYFEGPEGAYIGVDRLEWRHHDADEPRPPDEGWHPLSVEDEQVFEQPRPGRFTGELEFRLTLYMEDATGGYEGDLVFTVVGI